MLPQIGYGKDNICCHLQADEGAEGDEVVDEDVWHPGLPVARSSLSLSLLVMVMMKLGWEVGWSTWICKSLK